jgi:two-component system, chemotaxis family, CheB/CheR fusion protein
MTAADTTRELEALLDYLKRSRGFDFTGYKRSSLARRIQKRMQMVGIERYSDYLDYLEVRPDEFSHLFNMILINVTAFFRDPPAWDYLSEEILPRILADKGPQDLIRVWSAGCASGEEVYSLAMVLAEAVGLEGMRERVKIYATDADEEALTTARHATYSQRDLQAVPPNLLEKYFEKASQRCLFHKDLRRSVIFGRHDLIQDAPISRVDLLVCRNVLMYLNAETQGRILDRFHFALQHGGFLFLGKAEMLLTHANTFTPVDLKRRFFVKVARAICEDAS